MGLNLDCIHKVLMQVPQWAGPILMGRRGGPGPRAISGGWDQCPDYFLGPCLELAGGSGVTCIEILIKCESTQSNSRLLQVSK